MERSSASPSIIENIAGASGAIGAARVAHAAPDGHTLLFGAASQIIIAPLVQKTNYDSQKDFVPVSIFGAGPYILGVKPSLPAGTFQEFIAYARSNPGKLNYASAGPGGIIHLTSALLGARAGIDMVHVPYKSGAPALNGLLTGEIDVYFGNASELLQQASSGRVRLLAVSSAARLPQLPDMPTVGEFYPGFRVTSWNGFLAPAGTPQAIIQLLAKETRNAAKDPAIAERLLTLGIQPSGADPQEFAEVISGRAGFLPRGGKGRRIENRIVRSRRLDVRRFRSKGCRPLSRWIFLRYGSAQPHPWLMLSRTAGRRSLERALIVSALASLILRMF